MLEKLRGAINVFFDGIFPKKIKYLVDEASDGNNTFKDIDQFAN